MAALKLPYAPAGWATGPAPRLTGHGCQCRGLWDIHTLVPLQGLATLGYTLHLPCRTQDLSIPRTQESRELTCFISFLALPLFSRLIYTTQFNIEDGPRSLKTKSSLKILLFVLKHT